METRPLELPADLLNAANQLSAVDLATETARLLALELFRQEKVSVSRAAELCQTPLAAFMEFVAEHGVSPLNYGIEELEADRRTLAKLRA